MRRLTVSELLTATGGTLLAGGASAAVTSVSTDSRKAGEGALFIPLTGERFDGHDYIEKALSAGAEGCLCARVPEALLPGKFYIKVPDTLLALKDLAAWYRAQFSIPFVQVTGSVGKTTTKDLLLQILRADGPTVAPKLSFNNEVGLHARPATFFIQKANEFKSGIWVEKDERRVNAKSLLGVLSLGITKGTTITLLADGSDEKEAVAALSELVFGNFGE